MPSSSLFRLGGWSLLLGSLIALLGQLPATLLYTSDLYLLTPYVMLLSLPFLVFGLILLYARQSQYLGKWGLIGLFLLCTGLLFSVTLYVSPSQVPASYLILITLFRIAGAICFGIALIRVDLFPRWTGWALILGMCSVVANNALFLWSPNNPAFYPQLFVFSILFEVLVYGSLAQLGYLLLSTFSRTSQPPLSSSLTPLRSQHLDDLT